VDQMDGNASSERLGAAPGDVWVARLLVTAQMVLLGLIALLPARADWPVPGWLAIISVAAGVTGLAVMSLGATALGRGLTATPLPNRHAQLRTGGLYAHVRHPIYTGLLLLAASTVAASGSALRLVPFVLLMMLLTVKSSWEETRLTRRFPGYTGYAARTPRFIPRSRRHGSAS